MKKTIVLLTVTVVCAGAFLSCNNKQSDPYSEAHFAMGTVCTITLYETVTGFHFKEVFNIIDEIDAKMSVQKNDSEVNEINKQAGIRPVQVSEDTFFVIRESISYAELSGGKFDITVGPLVGLWGIGTEAAGVPVQPDIEKALSLIDYRNITLGEKNGTVFLEKKGMAIDLGAIAKGYAADVVRDYLRKRGFSRGIINFGGNVAVFGKKAGGEPWKIGVQDPYDTRGRQVGILQTGETAVVTSGIYERYFEQNGKVYHHILDTDTGYPVENDLAGVTIVTDRCITADAFSTIAFSFGLEEGLDLLEGIPEMEGIFVSKDKEIFSTSGLRDRFLVTNSVYTFSKKHK